MRKIEKSDPSSCDYYDLADLVVLVHLVIIVNLTKLVMISVNIEILVNLIDLVNLLNLLNLMILLILVNNTGLKKSILITQQHLLYAFSKQTPPCSTPCHNSMGDPGVLSNFLNWVVL